MAEVSSICRPPSRGLLRIGALLGGVEKTHIGLAWLRMQCGLLGQHGFSVKMPPVTGVWLERVTWPLCASVSSTVK